MSTFACLFVCPVHFCLLLVVVRWHLIHGFFLPSLFFDVVDAFSSCSKSVSDLTAKAAALSKNKDALTDVKAKVAKATGSTRAVATNCASFLVLIIQCMYIFKNNFTWFNNLNFCF